MPLLTEMQYQYQYLEIVINFSAVYYAGINAEINTVYNTEYHKFLFSILCACKHELGIWSIKFT